MFEHNDDYLDRPNIYFFIIDSTITP